MDIDRLSNSSPMFSFRTEGFNGYSIKYSPFHDSRLAVAASANFGLVGNGRVYVLGLTAEGIIAEKTFDTQDGLFDLAWSEVHENQLVVASGDGSVKLFDTGLNVSASRVQAGIGQVRRHIDGVGAISRTFRYDRGMSISGRSFQFIGTLWTRRLSAQAPGMGLSKL